MRICSFLFGIIGLFAVGVACLEEWDDRRELARAPTGKKVPVSSIPKGRTNKSDAGKKVHVSSIPNGRTNISDAGNSCARFFAGGRDSTERMPLGNVVFLLSAGRSGSTYTSNLIMKLTNAHYGGEILGEHSSNMVRDPVRVITEFVTNLRRTKYRYTPHKVILFKWKANMDNPAYRHAWDWAKRMGLVAVYNTRNDLDYLVSLEKMQHVDNTAYMCNEGNVACVERTRVAVHMKVNGTIAELEHTRAQTQAYEEEIKRYYGTGFKDGYVRVKYDQLMYSPTKQERMERLSWFANALWRRLSVEARTELERSVEPGDFVTQHTAETHDYAQWDAISNYKEVYEALRHTKWADLLHGPSCTPLDTSLNLAEARNKSERAGIEPIFGNSKASS